MRWIVKPGRTTPDPSLLTLHICPWLQNMPTCYPRLPWVIKMKGFQVKQEKNPVWFNDPVYSHFGGYKMGVRVHSNASGNARGVHLLDVRRQ